MNGVAAIRELLVHDSALTNLVPSARIASGILPQGTPLPAIIISSISSNDRNIIKPTATRQVNERIQVTVMAPDYPKQKAIIKAVKKAAADKFPTVNGISDVVVLTHSAGPDFMDMQATIYMQHQDFIVSFNEAT